MGSTYQKTEEKRLWGKEWNALVKEFKENNSFDKEPLKGEVKEIAEQTPLINELSDLDTDLERTNFRINETIEEQVIETKATQQCESKLNDLSSNYQIQDKNQILFFEESRNLVTG